MSTLDQSKREYQLKIIKLLIVVSIVIITFARSIWIDDLGERIDSTTFNLIVLALLVILIPWENIKEFKAAGIEASFYQEQVKGAIKGLQLDDYHIEDKILQEMLDRKASEIEVARGSRVLWIDDYPHEVTGERRVFRALGIEVVPVRSSKEAEETLERDNDFDMIISDVQRSAETERRAEGVTIHHGIDFVMKLRTNKNPIIKRSPVIYYTAFKPETALKIT